MSYPYVDCHCNGWGSFWIETAPRTRQMFIASVAIIIEHIVNGLVLPVCYLCTHNQLYFGLAMYGEVAFMIYTSSWIAVSYLTGRDVTVEQMHPAVWPLLLLHHFSTLVLCIGCILIGESVPKDLVCYVLLALLGLTSSLHYVNQILDFSPMSLANAPRTRLLNHIFCLASQIAFRVVYWVQLIYLSVIHCLEFHGSGIGLTVLLIMLLFTAFNVDFVKFHFKATRACWTKMREMNKID